MELTVKTHKDCQRIAKALAKTDSQASNRYADKYQARRSIQKAAVNALTKTW